jgi:hypothetical protein
MGTFLTLNDGLTPQQRYRKSHPDRANAITRKWRAANPDKVKAQKARYRDKPENREKAKEQSRRWRLNNLEWSRRLGKAWAENNPDKKLSSSLICKYGISLGEYNSLLDKQGGGCAICGKPQGVKRLHIDHDHVSKKVRGLLCHQCNLMLGTARDSADILQVAIAYIEENGDVYTVDS